MDKSRKFGACIVRAIVPTYDCPVGPMGQRCNCCNRGATGPNEGATGPTGVQLVRMGVHLVQSKCNWSERGASGPIEVQLVRPRCIWSEWGASVERGESAVVPTDRGVVVRIERMDVGVSDGMDEQAMRMHDLLWEYYGSEEEGSDEKEGEERGWETHDQMGVNDPSESNLDPIDTQSFDATTYVDELLRKERLPELFQKHATLATDVKQLDCDMQALVYENYNKFIAATETIRTLRRDVDGMEDTCEKLKQAMKEVQDSSMVLGGSESNDAEELGQLQDLQTTLSDLQHLMSLPRNIQIMVEQGRLEDAAKEVAQVFGPLQELASDYPGSRIAQAAQEVETEVAKLKETLLDRMNTVEEDGEAAANIVEMLVLLGMEPTELEEEYCQPLMKRMLEEMEQSATNAEGEDKGRVLESLSDAFCTQLAQVIGKYRTVFAHVGQEVPRSISIAMDAFARLVRSVLCSPPLLGAEELVVALDALVKKFASLDDLPAKVSLETNARRIARLCILSCLEAQASEARERLLHALEGIADKCSQMESRRGGPVSRLEAKEVSTSSHDAFLVFVKDCADTIHALSAILKSAEGYRLTDSWREELISHVAAIETNLLEDVASSMLDRCGLDTSKMPTPRRRKSKRPDADEATVESVHEAQNNAVAPLYLLISAQVLRDILEEGLSEITGALNAVEVGVDVQSNRVAQTLRQASDDLLQAHRARHVKVLSNLLTTTTLEEDWSRVGPPESVRVALFTAEDAITNMYNETAAVLGGEDLKSPTHTLDGVSALERDVARMFDSRLNSMDRRGPDSVSLVLQAVQESIQEWEACWDKVRLHRDGYRQLQVDCAYLKVYMNRFVDSTVSDQLLDRVLASARRSCTDPEPLEASVVEDVLSKPRPHAR